MPSELTESDLAKFRDYLHKDPSKTQERIEEFFRIVDELNEILDETNEKVEEPTDGKEN